MRDRLRVLRWLHRDTNVSLSSFLVQSNSIYGAPRDFDRSSLGPNSASTNLQHWLIWSSCIAIDWVARWTYVLYKIRSCASPPCSGSTVTHRCGPKRSSMTEGTFSCASIGCSKLSRRFRSCATRTSSSQIFGSGEEGRSRPKFRLSDCHKTKPLPLASHSSCWRVVSNRLTY